MNGGHVQVGLISSNPWLVLSSFVYCVSVVPVASYVLLYTYTESHLLNCTIPFTKSQHSIY